MRKTIFGLTLGVFLLVLCFLAEAQQPKKIPRIGYLTTRSDVGALEKAFLRGLQSLGYIEGQTIAIERRFAQEKFDRLPDLANEIVGLNVDVIVASGGYASVQAVKKATTTIPIVMTNVNDAVGLGLVASLAQPGGNVTGSSALSPELSGKQLELLKETVPKASRVAVLTNPSGPNWKLIIKEIEPAARSLGVQLQVLEMRGPDDLDRAFQAAKRQRAEAFLLPASGILALSRKRIVEFVLESRLPAIGSNVTWAEEGCLLGYGPSVTEFYRRAATYVDKILKGAKPAELPVEQPMKFEFVINLKTANQIGVTIPPNVLARADRVIR